MLRQASYCGYTAAVVAPRVEDLPKAGWGAKPQDSQSATCLVCALARSLFKRRRIVSGRFDPAIPGTPYLIDRLLSGLGTSFIFRCHSACSTLDIGLSSELQRTPPGSPVFRLRARELATQGGPPAPPSPGYLEEASEGIEWALSGAMRTPGRHERPRPYSRGSVVCRTYPPSFGVFGVFGGFSFPCLRPIPSLPVLLLDLPLDLPGPFVRVAEPLLPFRIQHMLDGLLGLVEVLRH